MLLENIISKELPYHSEITSYLLPVFSFSQPAYKNNLPDI